MTDHVNLSSLKSAGIRESQDRITKNPDLTARYLEHAVQVKAYTAALKSAGIAVKASFAGAGLDYGLARHAVYIASIVHTLEESEPRVRELGPSLLLLLHEASRRFAREGRANDLTAMLDEMLSGTSRSALRVKYLPPKRQVTSPQPATIANAFERLLASGA